MNNFLKKEIDYFKKEEESCSEHLLVYGIFKDIYNH